MPTDPTPGAPRATEEPRPWDLDHAETLIRRYGMAEARRDGIIKAGCALRDFVEALVREHALSKKVAGQSLDEITRLRAAITTPEVYYGVVAEEVAEAYEKQGAELRQTRAEVERLTAERDEAVEWLGVIRDELVTAGYPPGDRTVALANIRALIARASRREEALREILKLDYGFLAAKSIASHALTEGGEHGGR